jgi:hypothetical protein
VPLADGDLIDGDLAQVFELGFGVATPQVTLLHVFDDVPTDPKVARHIEDGHAP